ncbi:MAG: hypothetical protein KC469_10755 [Flavobacteriaceae bacterium]|nr:hypothetical protein [Flavobacteriaceae bacterium]
MKKLILSKLSALALIMVVLSSCSSVKVLSTWTADDTSDFRDNNILVIARTDDTQARTALEQEISKMMRADGMSVTESYKKFPRLNPDNKERSQDDIDEAISIIKNEGFDGIVLTVLKDTQTSTQTTSDGGYYSGATWGGYYPRYYGGFNSYYYHPTSYSTYGTYSPTTYSTSTTTKYILETVCYDLTKTGEGQLAAVITTEVTDPKDMRKVSEEFVAKVSKALEKK